LTNALDDENLAGVVVLALRPGDPKVVTPLLIHALKNPSTATRGNAADFLAGKDPALAVPALIGMLDDAKFYPKQRAAIALATFGPAAAPAAPKLLAMYTNLVNGPDMRLAYIFGSTVLEALQAIGGEPGAQAETFLLNSGPTNLARLGYTRTPLPGGKELIAGGSVHTRVLEPKYRVLASAELYDPATAAWTETGRMAAARDGHSAILLGSGKVLVAGGSDESGRPLLSAELYDPLTGKWAPTGALSTVHHGKDPALQHDGTVRLAGSWDGTRITDDEVYDSRTARWTVAPRKSKR
jgi:hypothetical protein